jgi:hypothetical protein
LGNGNNGFVGIEFGGEGVLRMGYLLPRVPRMLLYDFRRKGSKSRMSGIGKIIFLLEFLRGYWVWENIDFVNWVSMFGFFLPIVKVVIP